MRVSKITIFSYAHSQKIRNSQVIRSKKTEGRN